MPGPVPCGVPVAAGEVGTGVVLLTVVLEAVDVGFVNVTRDVTTAPG